MELVKGMRSVSPSLRAVMGASVRVEARLFVLLLAGAEAEAEGEQEAESIEVDTHDDRYGGLGRAVHGEVDGADPRLGEAHQELALLATY